MLDIKNLFQKTKIEDDPYYEGDLLYKTKIDPYKYYTVEEGYSLGFAEAQFYCKESKNWLEELILDDDFIIRLYDKNGKAIDEYKMRNRVALEDYQRDPKAYENKLKEYGSTDAWLMGMLKLPPKNKRTGLKYRA